MLKAILGSACNKGWNLSTENGSTETNRTNILSRLMVIFNTNESAPSRAILYTPFSNQDMLLISIVENITRLKNNKPLLPLIVQNDHERRKLEDCRALLERESHASGRQNVITLKHEVLSNMQILSNANGNQLENLNPRQDKIYIIGYGGPGNKFLYPTASGNKEGRISAVHLVEELRKGHLPKNFRDFRLTSCNSADARKPASFSSSDLLKATRPKLGHRSFLLCGTQSEAKVPLAQTFSEALALFQFGQAEVTGYHGAGQVFSQAACSVQSISNNESPLLARRSTVKSIFKTDDFGHTQITHNHSDQA